jgi:hypothetical protein
LEILADVSTLNAGTLATPKMAFVTVKYKMAMTIVTALLNREEAGLPACLILGPLGTNDRVESKSG